MPTALRRVACYHCGAGLEVPPGTRSTMCRACYRSLTLEDLRVSQTYRAGLLSTCGRVWIDRTSRTVTRAVRAGEGVEVLGSLEAVVTSGGEVHVARNARLRGDVVATSVVFDHGSNVECALLRVAPPTR